MQHYPHHYLVDADGESQGVVTISSQGLQSLPTMPPPEFGGPEGFWSPETLLVSAVANCYILTFRSMARAAKFDWISMNCSVDGVLDRVDRLAQFTEFHVKVALHLPFGSDEAKARQILERTSSFCLITNSLKANEVVSAVVTFAKSS